MKSKDLQKYNRLIEATTTILSKEGMSGVSTTKVAQKAGIPQSNLYIYFKNKQILLEQVFLYHIHKMSVAINTQVDETKPLANQIEQSTRALYDFATSNLESIDVIQAIVQEPKTKQLATAKLDDEINQKVQERLASGLANHTFRAMDMGTLRYFLTEPIYNYVRRLNRRQVTPEETPLDQIIIMIMSAVLEPQVFEEWMASNEK